MVLLGHVVQLAQGFHGPDFSLATRQLAKKRNEHAKTGDPDGPCGWLMIPSKSGAEKEHRRIPAG